MVVVRGEFGKQSPPPSRKGGFRATIYGTRSRLTPYKRTTIVIRKTVAVSSEKMKRNINNMKKKKKCRCVPEPCFRGVFLASGECDITSGGGFCTGRAHNTADSFLGPDPSACFSRVIFVVARERSENANELGKPAFYRHFINKYTP